MSANTKPLSSLTRKAAVWYNLSSVAFLAKQEGGEMEGLPRPEHGWSLFHYYRLR
jgi:hypothetical protein